MCGAANGNYSDCAADTAWGDHGWLVKQTDTAGNDEVLKVWQKPHSDVAVTSTSEEVVFRPTGMLDAQGATATVKTVPVVFKLAVNNSPTLCYNVPMTGAVYLSACSTTDSPDTQPTEPDQASPEPEPTPTTPTHGHHHHG